MLAHKGPSKITVLLKLDGIKHILPIFLFIFFYYFSCKWRNNEFFQVFIHSLSFIQWYVLKFMGLVLLSFLCNN